MRRLATRVGVQVKPTLPRVMLAVLGLVLAVGPCSAQGSSPLPNKPVLTLIPHFVIGGGFVTVVSVQNLANSNNNVILQFLNQDGTAASNSAFTLAPGQTVERSSGEENRAGPATTQWIAIGSDAVISASVLFDCCTSGNQILSAVGVLPQAPATSFTAPFIFQRQTTDQPILVEGVAIANSSGVANTVSVRLLDQNGTQVSSDTLNPIPAFGQTAFTVSDLPNVRAQLQGRSTFLGSLVINGTQPCAPAIVGNLGGSLLSLPLDLSGAGATASASDTTAQAARSDQAQALPAAGVVTFIPHFVMGGGFVTRLFVKNLANSNQNLVIQFMNQDGTIARTESRTLAAGQTIQQSSGETNRAASQTTEWVVLGSDWPISASVLLDCCAAGPQVTSAVGVLAQSAGTTFTAPFKFQRELSNQPILVQGLALANGSATSNSMTIRLLDQMGTLTSTDNLAPVLGFGQAAFTLSSLPNLSAQLQGRNTFVGSLVVSGTQAFAPVIVGNIGGRLFSLPLASGGTSVAPSPSSLSVALSSSSLRVFQGEGPATVNATVTRTGATGNVTLSLRGLPSGAVAQAQSPGSGNSGSVTLASGAAAPGTYRLSVDASDGILSSSAPLDFTVGAVAQIGSAVTGRLDLHMSTSFQPAEWQYLFFRQNPSATTPLQNLLPQHIRLQPLSQGIPQTSPTTWDFSYVDAIAQPVLTVGDHSPQFQISLGPAFMYDSSGHLLDPTHNQFATYATQLVRYYNKGGFIAPDGYHVSPSPYPIQWWGIYGEPNLNNLSPSQYTQLYNVTVPAMQAVDPTLKFVAVELSDFDTEAQNFIPTFVSGVTAQVDALATHYYSSCDHNETDAQLFSTVPGFANGARYLYSQLATNPALASVPVWVTENNVNADFERADGTSECNGGRFTLDPRGSSAFFAAWRPYVFSQLGKAGARALYHWEFAEDAQYGEVNNETGQTRLSYWVDYWLARMFPSPPGANLLQFSATETRDLEVLAVRNDDGSVTVMVANHAVASRSDNNGPGAPRTVALDVAALGFFNSAELLVMDARTDVTRRPEPTPVLIGPRVEITLSGYGVAFLRLH